MQEYLNDYGVKISHVCQSLLDSLSIIVNRINELKDGVDDHPFLKMAGHELSELPFSAILPLSGCDGTYRLDLTDFGLWSEQLSKASEIIMKVYLCWVSDVIGNP